LTGKATAIAFGAATVVNAMALGKGAAFGVDLWTKAEVKFTDEPYVFVSEITSDPQESSVLIEKTVMRVLKRFSLESSFGAKIKTWSNIPIARGLKSSSAAANATALAATKALGEEVDDLAVVNLGVDAAFDAKVTVTGAFDDACASYFGGLAVTDNLKREIVGRRLLTEDFEVLFHVPSSKAYSGGSDVRKLQTVRSLVEIAYEQALKGKVWDALTLNGLIYSPAYGFSSAIAIDALSAGAVSAGLCGKGPAVTAVAPKDKADSVAQTLRRYGGEVLHARLNNDKAKVLG